MRWWLRGCSRSADALCGLCGAEERTWSEKGTAAKQGRLAASSMASPNAIGTARVGCPSSHGNTTLSPLAASRWACHSSLAARCSLLAASPPAALTRWLLRARNKGARPFIHPHHAHSAPACGGPNSALPSSFVTEAVPSPAAGSSRQCRAQILPSCFLP